MGKLSKFLPMFKKSVSFSQLLPGFKNNSPHWREWDTENAIQNGYKSSTYVFACINLIAKSSASVPWYVYRRTKGNQWEVVPEHPLQLLIEKPNPYQTRKDLMERMTQHLYLGGNAVFTKVRAGNIVAELWNLPPDAIKVIPSRENFIKAYVYEKDGVKVTFEPKDIMHNMFLDPANPYWGMSPLQAGARVIDTDIEAVAWNKVALQNRAITDGVFSFDSPLTRQQWEDARQMVRDQHQGITNSRTPWILGNGAKWQSMSMTPAEMDFIESRRFSREEICSLFMVPPPMIGILDKANYSNIETARKIFWLDCITPFLEDVKNCFNLSLTPEFGTDIYLDYDLSEVDALQENFTEKINNAKALFSMGVPFNEINSRLELGFDNVPGGDIGYLASGLMPADMLNDMPEPTAQQKPTNGAQSEAETGAKAFTPGENKTLMKALNLRSEEQKEFYADTVERRRLIHYHNMTRKSARLFKDEAQIVIDKLSNLNSYDKEEIERVVGQAIKSHQNEWTKLFTRTWQNVLEEIGTATYEGLREGLKSLRHSRKDETEPEAFNPYNEIIQAYMIETTATKVKNVCEFTKGIIAQLVYDIRNREENNTMDDIARAIKEQFDDFSRYRAYRIARTEVVGASNYASIQGAKQTGLDLKKEWVTSRDDRVRESHKKLHGEIRDMEEKFSNGLDFPGEYAQDVGGKHNINCRCVIAYINK